MVAFAKECFSDAECRARAVKPSGGTDAQPVASGSGVASGGGSADESMSFDDAIFGNAPDTNVGGRGVQGADADTGVSLGGAGADGNVGGGGAVVGADGSVGGGGASVGAAGASAGAGTGGVTVGEGPGAGAGAGEEGGEAALQQVIDELWQRDDREQWSVELSRAHAAFARGKAWGLEWAQCVAAFLDFEGACGYEDDGGKISTKERPKMVKDWLARARNWNTSMAIGTCYIHALSTPFISPLRPLRVLRSIPI
ncbi:hypothetical protein B0H11DRAFT_2265632 [Mycena galericulata]|nr:hypothetical protein B0H11DRAFT_2265632 [Mycena galericulata]